MRLSQSVSRTKTTTERTQDTSSQESQKDCDLLRIYHCEEGAGVSMKTNLTEEELVFVIKGCHHVLRTLTMEMGENERAN